MPFKPQTGLTLIELLVVLTIAGVLAAVAAPSFSSLINSMRQTSTMTQLTGDLNRARGEAIKRNQRVLLCVRDSDTACGAGTNWQNGWLVCYDENQDGACDASTATNPNPIVVHPALHSTLTLTGNAAFVRFNPSGTQGTGAAATLALAGTWSGAITSTASVAATGNISKTP